MEADALATMLKVQAGFGQPHIHAGVSIRKLAPDIFECRTDLKTRLVFLAQKGLLTFDFAATTTKCKITFAANAEELPRRKSGG